MKRHIQKLLTESIKALEVSGVIAAPKNTISIESTRDAAHGDFASNIALQLARETKINPRVLAEKIIDELPVSNIIGKTEIAGPGFINFFLNANAFQSIIMDIFDEGDAFGSSNQGQHKKILLEFVSANPTGPLHVGHGRGAAYGAAVESLLQKTGYDVSCEYYVNNAGRQIDILTISIWLRYLEHYQSHPVDIMGHIYGSNPQRKLPDNAYHGDYICKIATDLALKYEERFNRSQGKLPVISNDEDEEVKIDALIQYAIESLGKEDYYLIFNAGVEAILATIKRDLQEFGIKFDNWFSEQSLSDNNDINRCIKRLHKNGHVYEKDGATWFNARKFGDEKDRVLIRANGRATYFASDIAYHLVKVERGYDKLINIWGADHHGYIMRIKAAMQALALDPEKLEILLVQFATLYRGKEKLQMSTRSGEFVTLKKLQDEVGKDAARFFYILRKSKQHLDFDLELAKSQSNDNPVYYIQYAYARVCSVFRKMTTQGYAYNRQDAIKNLSALTEVHEIKLLRTLTGYPDIIENSARLYEPHQLAYYLKDLANDFHTYYNACQFLLEDTVVRNARLALIDATGQTIKNGLSLLGVDAPETM